MGTYSQKVLEHKSYLFKGGLHSIESSIAAEAKISNLMRRLKTLKTKEPVPVNQVCPKQFSNPGCTYCQAMNYVFE